MTLRLLQHLGQSGERGVIGPDPAEMIEGLFQQRILRVVRQP